METKKTKQEGKEKNYASRHSMECPCPACFETKSGVYGQQMKYEREILHNPVRIELRYIVRVFDAQDCYVDSEPQISPIPFWVLDK